MAHRTDDNRSITAVGFARLLARLHPDVGEAGHEYERLRRALVKFFDWRGALSPDECADEALDRLARKLDETAVDDVRNYALGIARSEDGDVFVIRAGPKYELLAKNVVGEVVMATPAISDGLIIIRGLKTVFAIGERR
jgi:hypothetical protein